MIPKLEHNWETAYQIDKEADCTTEGSKSIHCKECNTIKSDSKVVIPKLEHEFDEWKVIESATVLKNGLESRTCTKCKTEEKRSIEKLEAKVKLNASSVPIQLKKSTTAIKIKTQAEEDRVLSWTSSNKKIITVNKKTGKITAKKLGTAYVIVKMKSGATAKIDF